MDHKTITRKINQRVAAFIQEQERTQEEVAEWLGTTQATVSRKLAGRTRFTAEELYILSRHFTVGVEQLFPRQ